MLRVNDIFLYLKSHLGDGKTIIDTDLKLKESSRDRILDLIEQKAPTVILTHRNPDGDAVGSSIALGLFLKKTGVPVDVIIPNEVPDFLNWLPGSDLVRVFRKKPDACTKLIRYSKLIVCLDFNDPDRIGDIQELVAASEAFKILIDHHEDPVAFTDDLISEPWRGSVGEMVYHFIEAFSTERLIDHDMATCLYVAIMTDTGNFRYGCSYPDIFHVTGELMRHDIDNDRIYAEVYDSYSEKRMRLMGYCMQHKMVVIPEYHTAYIYLTREELKRFDHQTGDTEGFVNIPFTIKGMRFTALFVEKKGHVKISLRSKGDFAVNDFTEKHFNGGGHINAAGGEEYLSLQDTLEKFESLLPEYADKLA